MAQKNGFIIIKMEKRTVLPPNGTQVVVKDEKAFGKMAK